MSQQRRRSPHNESPSCQLEKWPCLHGPWSSAAADAQGLAVPFGRRRKFDRGWPGFDSVAPVLPTTMASSPRISRKEKRMWADGDDGRERARARMHLLLQKGLQSSDSKKN